MKTKPILFGLILLTIGCGNPPQDDKAANGADEKTVVDSADTVAADPLEPIWSYDYNQQTNDFELNKLRSVDQNKLTGEALEKILNRSWPEVQIKFVKTSNDTAYIAIPDSRVLTRQMGSAGARGYMISTTYSLTELKGIRHVSYTFEEGDHAAPGVYSRSSWDVETNE